MRSLRVVAAVSGVYDLSVGAVMPSARPLLSRLVAVPLLRPPIHADLNGVFLLVVGLSCLIPWRDPVRGRGYLWVTGRS